MMEDRALHKLKHIMPPQPSKVAQQHALHAARQSFETSPDPQIEKNVNSFQGFGSLRRLIHSFNQKLWSVIMKKKLILGTALAGVLAITMTTTMWQKGELSPPNEESKIIAQQAAATPEPVELEPATPKPSKAAPIPAAPPILALSIAKEKREAERSPISNGTLNSMARSASLSSQTLSFNMEVSKVNGVQSSRLSHPPTSMRFSPTVPAEAAIGHYAQDEGRDQFEKMTPNAVKKVSEAPVSTFSIDVDTAAYAFMRKSLNNGRLPQKHAVRVEEFINYFDYDYPLPFSAETPFKPTVVIYPTPWNKQTKLLHIGIKGHDILPTEKPRSNLVFLLDVSGSMHSPDKLSLLKNAFRLLVENLQPADTIAIVTYAGRAGTVLMPTKVAEKAKILLALERLRAGGSTAGAQGIQQAYALAKQNFDKQGINRVILATDGDFNVGITNREELQGFVERQRASGIFLSVLGFGQGNYNDALMQALAQNGNGNAAYIDSLNEARKVLVDEANSTLFPIAKDVKIQIEFNPNTVSEYRLIGYETRLLKREDFKNDKVDAGEIGSGHTVTALYEITPIGSPARLIDDLRYQPQEDKGVAPGSGEYAFLKLRYKRPEEESSQLIEMAIDNTLELETISITSEDIRFAASVAAFGQLLRGDSHLGEFSYDDIIALAKGARGDDAFGYRSEFLNLVRLAKSAQGM